MAGYIGARSQAVSSTSIAKAQDFTATDTTPEVTIVNNTHEDTDGGREGKVIFKGQQSGGEESTLAEIQGSHDGTADDEKGDLIFKTNDGSDGASPTERMRIDSNGAIGIGTTDTSSSTNQKNIFLGGTGNIYADTSAVADASLSISQNAKVDADNSWEYIVTDEASNYYQNAGNHVWRSAASGTAGNDITWSESMRVSKDGYFMIGTTTEGHPQADDITIGGSGHRGITVRSDDSNEASVFFSDGTSGGAEYVGALTYQHANDSLNFYASGIHALVLNSGGVLEKYGNSASARIIPQSDNAGYIGESSHRWQAIYAVNGSIQTSDKNLKTEITDSALGLDFVKALRPVSYKWISGGKHFEYDKDDDRKSNPTITDVAGKRNHYGLIAQEVKEALGDTDFGGWVSEDVTDENATQSLRYDQFIAPLIKAVQELNAEIETLKTKVAALEG
ncbi:MAG: hypothetical protein CM1200mV1_230 [uncultured marine virus]|nr:MAG: hypothetical protein CM1200mV1_230 [uncultured marine virus]